MSRIPRQALGFAGVAGIGFFAMSVVLLALLPGRALEEETHRTSPAHPLHLTPSEERGREIYSRNGCAYCHTEQIRATPADVARFGPSTEAWETQFDYPHLWGTRRIGPDLSRESAARSEDWQFTHLYQPRWIVPDSVMPAFPSMFDGAPDRPAQEARDLVAYIESLGRARDLASPERIMTSVAFVLRPVPQGVRAEEIYLHNCAGCHGAKGEGDGSGAVGLRPRPANLAAHEYNLKRLAFVLANGVHGTSMPSWKDLNPDDVASAAAMARSFYSAAPESAPPAELRELGRQVYTDRCAQCHGENGAGDGSAAGELSVRPTDFTGERPTAAEALRALRNGVEGTPMAPWNTKLSEAELNAVASFVREFYR